MKTMAQEELLRTLLNDLDIMLTSFDWNEVLLPIVSEKSQRTYPAHQPLKISSQAACVILDAVSSHTNSGLARVRQSVKKNKLYEYHGLYSGKITLHNNLSLKFESKRPGSIARKVLKETITHTRKKNEAVVKRVCLSLLNSIGHPDYLDYLTEQVLQSVQRQMVPVWVECENSCKKNIKKNAVLAPENPVQAWAMFNHKNSSKRTPIGMARKLG